MDLEQRLRQRAEHEVLHSLYATTCGFGVARVSYWPHGETDILWPFPHWQLYRHYMANPLATIGALKQILGVLHAPHIIQNTAPAGVDLETTERLRQKWACYRLLTRPRAKDWPALMDDVRTRVQTWACDVGRRTLIATLTDALIQRGTMNGAEWTHLVKTHAPPWLRETAHARLAS
jgi:hypothetical protein